MDWRNYADGFGSDATVIPRGLVQRGDVRDRISPVERRGRPNRIARPLKGTDRGTSGSTIHARPPEEGA